MERLEKTLVDNIVESVDSEVPPTDPVDQTNLQDQCPGPSEPIYLSYWPSRAPNLETEEERNKFGQVAAENFQSVYTSRQRLLKLEDSGKDYNCFREVESWYRQLGAMSQLHGSVEDLNIAYDLVLQPSSLADEPRRQYIAGCLRHEAALVASDTTTKKRWLKEAKYHYDQVADITSFSDPQQTAIRLWHDIRFEQLFDLGQRLEKEKVPQDSHLWEGLQFAYNLAQLDYINDFEAMCRLRLTHDSKGGRSMMGGRLFEWFCVLAYRDLVSKRNKINQTTIRTAFPREDRPIDGLSYRGLPKQANDMVITHFDELGQTKKRYSVQQKINSKGNYDEAVKKVRVRGSQNRLVGEMRHAAKLIGRRVDNVVLPPAQRAQLEKLVNELIEPELVEA